MLGNPDFETGQLSPWVTNGAWVISNSPHDGSFAAEDVGNFNISQTIAPVPVANLTSASFWTYHNPNDGPLMEIDWTYSDNSKGQLVLFSQQLANWVFVDLLPLMDKSKSLTNITCWGFSGGGSQLTRVDTFLFCQ